MPEVELSAMDKIRERLRDAEMDHELTVLEELIQGGIDCVRNWEHGDLAGAVHGVELALQELGIDPQEEDEEED